MENKQAMNVVTSLKVFLGITIAIGIISFGWWSSKIGLPSELPDSALLRQYFEAMGVWGPLAVIGSMTVAIMVSPIPSAPIALSAGAIYGHFWGSLYILVGSVIGALGAFAVARVLGRDALHSWFGKQISEGLVGSQGFLMGAVFASRLLPFVSFDIISYAAGLTALSYWRFALATLAGIIPASFLLGHLGSELIADEKGRILFSVILLGILFAIPLIIKLITMSRQK